MNELNVICLPDFGMAKDEDEWVLLVQKSLEEKGIKTNIDFLKILWKFAQKTVDRMGDIFWDPDVTEPCAYCHKNDRKEKCEYLAGRYPVKGAACVWYGITASERMMSYAAKTVLESLIAVVYYKPKEELVEFCRSINCFYRDYSSIAGKH
jgi:hypothetical protein